MEVPLKTKNRAAMWSCNDLKGATGGKVPVQETKETQVWSVGQEHLLEEGLATHSSILPGESSILPGESHGQRSLVVYSP